MDRNEDAHAELVWAKFSRYPWWPAFLTGSKVSDGVEVQFFGTFELSVVKEELVKPFNGPPPLDAKNLRSRRLQTAVESAFNVYEGESTIREEKRKVANGCWVSNPARLNKIIMRISEQIQAETPNDQEPLKFDSADTFSQTENGASPYQSCQKLEPFETLQLRVQNLYEKLLTFNDEFESDFEDFCGTVKELLEERHVQSLTASPIGRMLVHIKTQIQSSGLSKELRRRALYGITTLLTSMKKKIIDYFFTNSEPIGTFPPELSAELSEKILDLTVKADEKALNLASTSPKRTSSNWTTPSRPQKIEPELLREKLKISLDVMNRVLKKFSKFLLQYSDQKLSKPEAERLAKLIHEQICLQASTVNEYKRAVVTFVQKRAELCDFFKLNSFSDQDVVFGSLWDQLYHLLFR